MSIQITYNDPEDQKAYDAKVAWLDKSEKELIQKIKAKGESLGKKGMFLDFYVSTKFLKSKRLYKLHEEFRDFTKTLGESTMRIRRPVPYVNDQI